MPPAAQSLRPLVLEPIGVVRTDYASRVEAPRQPAATADRPGRIELISRPGIEHALEDLAGWESIWVIFWFHLNEGWRPKVLPPRSTTGRKGVFATRSPHRPNPLGLSAVRLERVEGLTLHVRGLDMVDGTPVLDIKPYVPYTDAHPGARSGWLEDERAPGAAAAPADPVAPWRIAFRPLAAEQAAWIERHTGLDLRRRIEATLALGPAPHPYRRIRRDDAGGRLAIKDWRVRFATAEREVEVLAIDSGYRPSQLARPAVATDPLAPHREFLERWPRGTAA